MDLLFLPYFALWTYASVGLVVFVLCHFHSFSSIWCVFLGFECSQVFCVFCVLCEEQLALAAKTCLSFNRRHPTHLLIISLIVFLLFRLDHCCQKIPQLEYQRMYIWTLSFQMKLRVSNDSWDTVSKKGHNW